jgi:hypothetical protein
MKAVCVACLAAALAGCGVETAGTAATAAAIKKQELEQGKKTLEQAQQKVQQSVELEQSRAAAAEPAEK